MIPLSVDIAIIIINFLSIQLYSIQSFLPAHYNDNCTMKCYSFISSFNKLHCSYVNMQPCILSKLFKSFYTFYDGSSLWNFPSEGFRKITTLWNIAVNLYIYIT